MLTSAYTAYMTIQKPDLTKITPTMRLGDLIRKLRQEKNITLRKMAEQVGISAAHMSDIETNKRHPSEKYQNVIAQVLGVDEARLRRADSRIDPEIKRWAEEHPVVGVMLRQLKDAGNPEQVVQEWLKDLARKERSH